MRQKIRAGARHIVRHSTQPAKRVHFYVLIWAMIILWMIYGRNGATQTNADLAYVPPSGGRRVTWLTDWAQMRSAPVTTSSVTTSSVPVATTPINRDIELIEVEAEEEAEEEAIPKINTIPKDANWKIVPAIAMWYGKVNQHFNPATGKRASDPDGVAGAWTSAQWWQSWWWDRKLEYCKRFFPNTTSIRSVGNVTIYDWKAGPNSDLYTNTVEWRECVQPTRTRGILSWYTLTWPVFTWTVRTGTIRRWTGTINYSGTLTINITPSNLAQGSVVNGVQPVAYGGTSKPVTAVPFVSLTWSGTSYPSFNPISYRFLRRSDGNTTNPRTFSNVTQNIILKAEFAALPKINITPSSIAHGSIINGTQQVLFAGTSSIVTAVPYNGSGTLPGTGYKFVRWSDGVTVNPRTFTNVTQDITLKAEFAPLVKLPPRFSKVADGNATDLITLRISAPQQDFNTIIHRITYAASAQVSTDLNKSYKVFARGTQVAAGTLRATGPNGIEPIIFTNPLTLLPGQTIDLTIRLDSPFINTAISPSPWQRTFRIQNVGFTRGNNNVIQWIPQQLMASVWLPVVANNY